MSTVSITTPTTGTYAGLKTSFAYRRRIAITVICVLVGLSGTLMTPPDVIEGTPQDHFCDALGWSTLIAAILLRLWSSTHIAGRKSKALVTTGPYALCRNPLYVGTLLIAISQMLILKSWPFALVSVIPIVLYVVGVVPSEEHLLRQRFGSLYAEYCEHVPRWTPKWSSLNLELGSPENSIPFRRECILCAWWCLLPLASEFICGLRELIWPAV